jgi:ArsR family transcriptional regulator
MSKQSLPVLQVEDACCAPLAEAAISADDAADQSLAFKALGDPIRLRLMSMIASSADGEMCVCDLTPAFELSGPTISHHLKVLREAGLIEATGEERGSTGPWRRLAALSASSERGSRDRLTLDLRSAPVECVHWSISVRLAKIHAPRGGPHGWRSWTSFSSVTPPGEIGRRSIATNLCHHLKVLMTGLIARGTSGDVDYVNIRPDH